MAIVSITIGIILIIVALLAFTSDDARGTAVIPLFFGILYISIGIGVSCDKSTPKEPTALDVYRGNTTLEITYRDSVAIDSVVVFKKYGK